MSYGELAVLIAVSIVGWLVWWTRPVAKIEPTVASPVVTPADAVGVVPDARRRLTRERRPEPFPLVRCTLMDGDERTVDTVVELPRHRRRPVLHYEGQSYAAASGSNAEGFVYRRVGA